MEQIHGTPHKSGSERYSHDIAVFLFAITKHWCRAYDAGGARIPNHMFASQLAVALLLENGPPEHLCRRHRFAIGPISIDARPKGHNEVIAYLALNPHDITFLIRYYKLDGKMRPLSFLNEKRKFLALYERTPQFPVDMRDFAALAIPAQPGSQYADPATSAELCALDPDTLVPLNTAYELVLGKGCRKTGRHVLNQTEYAGDYLIREENIYVTAASVVPFIDMNTTPKRPQSVADWLKSCSL